MNLIGDYKVFTEELGKAIVKASNEGRVCNVNGSTALLLTDIAHSLSIMAEESSFRSSQKASIEKE